MSTGLDHEEVRDLLGAYAINAVSPKESLAVAAHLHDCEACRSEVDQAARSAALLGSLPALPPESLWQRIEARIDESQPPAPPLLVRPSNGAGMAKHAKVTIAAAIFVAFAGTASLTGVTLDTSFNQPSREEIARRSSSTTGARTVVLSGAEFDRSATVVLLPDGRGFLLDSNLPELRPDRTYQLWAVMGQSAISAAVLGPNPNFSPFTAAGDVTALAITEERAGGVVASDNRPVLSGVVNHT